MVNGTRNDEEPEPQPGDAPAMPPAVGRRVRLGLGLSVALAALLAVATPLSVLQSVALAFFVLLLPALALAQTPLLGLQRLDRIPVYVGSALTILLIGALALVVGIAGPGADAIGFVGLAVGPFVAWTLGAAAAGVLITLLFRPLDRALAGGPPRVLRDLIPETPLEKGVFAGLSLAAGWGEEAAYRGYVPAVLATLLTGVWLPMAVAAAAFGFLHAYQGPVGVVRTACMGMVMAVPVVVTGSLLPAMAAHALFDVLAGLVLAPVLLGPDEGSRGGVAGTSLPRTSPEPDPADGALAPEPDPSRTRQDEP